MTAGCGRRGAEPKPSRRAGTSAFSLPFELPQPPGAAVPPSTDRESWGGGVERGTVGRSTHNTPCHRHTDPLPGLHPIHPGFGAAPGFRASPWGVWRLHQDGSSEFWFCRAPGHAIPWGRGVEGVLPGPGKPRAGGRSERAGRWPAHPRDSARPGGGRGGVAILELKKKKPRGNFSLAKNVWLNLSDTRGGPRP